jgi:hypothetical protein
MVRWLPKDGAVLAVCFLFIWFGFTRVNSFGCLTIKMARSSLLNLFALALHKLVRSAA